MFLQMFDLKLKYIVTENKNRLNVNLFFHIAERFHATRSIKKNSTSYAHLAY